MYKLLSGYFGKIGGLPACLSAGRPAGQQAAQACRPTTSQPACQLARLSCLQSGEQLQHEGAQPRHRPLGQGVQKVVHRFLHNHTTVNYRNITTSQPRGRERRKINYFFCMETCKYCFRESCDYFFLGNTVNQQLYINKRIKYTDEVIVIYK